MTNSNASATANSILLLDGATGTELDRRGVNVELPLWSALAIITAPDVLEQVHADYLEAGAGAVTANTFRTHRRTLAKAEMGDRAKELTTRAVEIARAACDRVKPDALILGSVAPLEDCYRPDLAPSRKQCEAEHRLMMTDLLDAGVDYLLIETQNTRHEAIAAAQVAEELAPGRWIISFCPKTVGPPGVLLNGAPLADVAPVLEHAYAVGVNCLSVEAIAPQLRLLRAVLPESVRLIAYGNSGHADPDGNWVTTDFGDHESYADCAEEWVAAGARIIGGCCGTTPDTIRAVAKRLLAGG